MLISIRLTIVPGCVLFNNFIMIISLKIKRYISILIDVFSIKKVPNLSMGDVPQDTMLNVHHGLGHSPMSTGGILQGVVILILQL